MTSVVPHVPSHGRYSTDWQHLGLQRQTEAPISGDSLWMVQTEATTKKIEIRWNPGPFFGKHMSYGQYSWLITINRG